MEKTLIDLAQQIYDMILTTESVLRYENRYGTEIVIFHCGSRYLKIENGLINDDQVS